MCAKNTLLNASIEPIEPELILIPDGEFLMGNALEIGRVHDEEKPQHPVYLPGYYIARAPVTNIQYLAFVKATGYFVPEHWRWGGGQIPLGKEDHPVVCVSWHNALAYCRWLSEVTGKPYRLPTEAEWEKAARGTDGLVYPWGDEWQPLCNSQEAELKDTAPVGSYSPQGDSPYGCVDMAGNVWQWTSTLYKPYPYSSDDGREDMDVDGLRVLRGSSYYTSYICARCTYRAKGGPCYSGLQWGFRLAASCS